MFRLQVVPATGSPFDHLLEQGSLVIGRSSDSGLVIADRFLSRHHARLFLDDGDLYVEDLQSSNGTLLNDRPVKVVEPVMPGDVLKMSGSVVTIHRTDSSAVSHGLSERGIGQMTVLRPASDLVDKSSSSNTGEIMGEENLRRFAARLQLLNEVHAALSRPIAKQDLLDLILERAFVHLKPEEGAIFLESPEGGYVCAARRAERTDDQSEEYLYSRTLVREVAEKGVAAVVLDAQTDERFADAQSIMTSGVRSLVAAPLLDPQGCSGMIVLNSRVNVRQFAEEDMEILAAVASVAALRLRNVALAEEAAEQRHLAREVQLARRIQLALLPSAIPEVAGYELFGGNIPSGAVSGDYYEIVERAAGREVVLLITDVSGKGVTASLLAASLEALASGPIEDGLAPEEIFNRVSPQVFLRTPPERYATSILAVLDTADGTVRYVNAGHFPGLIVRTGGEVERLGSTGKPLGLLPGGDYAAGETELAPGDILFLYTDGFLESENAEGEEFGIERLQRLVSQHRHAATLAELGSALEDALEQHVGDVPVADDRTLVVARRRAG